jgi:hypothetical protein
MGSNVIQINGDPALVLVATILKTQEEIEIEKLLLRL